VTAFASLLTLRPTPQAAEAQAQRVAQWQLESGEAHRRLLAATGTIVAEAAYIQAALAAVESTQRQSTALLVRIC